MRNLRLTNFAFAVKAMPIHLILCGLSQTELIWLYSIKSIVKIDLVIREATCGLDSMERNFCSSNLE